MDSSTKIRICQKLCLENIYQQIYQLYQNIKQVLKRYNIDMEWTAQMEIRTTMQ